MSAALVSIFRRASWSALAADFRTLRLQHGCIDYGAEKAICSIKCESMRGKWPRLRRRLCCNGLCFDKQKNRGRTLGPSPAQYFDCVRQKEAPSLLLARPLWEVSGCETWAQNSGRADPEAAIEKRKVVAG